MANNRGLPELSRDEYEPLIWKWIIGRNGERDRFIMGMYLFDGITYEEMLTRLEQQGYPMTLDNLKVIIKRRKQQLRSHL